VRAYSLVGRAPLGAWSAPGLIKSTILMVLLGQLRSGRFLTLDMTKFGRMRMRVIVMMSSEILC
jgi:hypothetical protein